ncbi:MAG TPA: hypothetical protein VK869_05700 [Rubrobacteraceae bacterium]|nr:hypothetical protein [Rubrobacteraceae bacterium]
MDFRASDPRTIGMELEFQLLDAHTLDLVDGILPLMNLYPGSPYIKPEVVQNTTLQGSAHSLRVPGRQSMWCQIGHGGDAGASRSVAGGFPGTASGKGALLV